MNAVDIGEERLTQEAGVLHFATNERSKVQITLMEHIDRFTY